jgi:hypothetical protein
VQHSFIVSGGHGICFVQCAMNKNVLLAHIVTDLAIFFPMTVEILEICHTIDHPALDCTKGKLILIHDIENGQLFVLTLKFSRPKVLQIDDHSRDKYEFQLFSTHVTTENCVHPESQFS